MSAVNVIHFSLDVSAMSRLAVESKNSTNATGKNNSLGRRAQIRACLFFVREEIFLERYQIGGQAIIEGVLMRGRNFIATAVRKSDGSIDLKTRRVRSISDRYPILKLPLIRGIVSIFESMTLGIKSMNDSARISGDEEQLTDSELKLTMILAIGFAIGFFIVIPDLTAKFLNSIDPNLVEGLTRIGMLLIYLTMISKFRGMNRILQYHGAEHQTINCYESGEDLTVENVRKCSRFHPRCGTSFLLIVILVSILIFGFIDLNDLWIRIASQILLLPIIAGISYELIRSKNPIVRSIISPLMYLQILTTRSPDDSMIEVAITALDAVKE